MQYEWTGASLEQDGPKRERHGPKQFRRYRANVPMRSPFDENVVVGQKPNEQHSPIKNECQHPPQEDGNIRQPRWLWEPAWMVPAADATEQQSDNDEHRCRTLHLKSHHSRSSEQVR